MRAFKLHPLVPAQQRGAVAVSFILLAIVLLGFMGLATDVGRLYVSKAELQNAADSCALAAAAALTGANADQLTAAENYGRTAGTRNRMGMQDVAVSIPADSAVTFSASLNGIYQTKGDVAEAQKLNMHYARCTLREEGIAPLVIQVLNALPGVNIGQGLVRATAVASLEPSISNCALPLAICSQGAAPSYGLAPGQWIEGRLDAGGSINGAFKWIRYPGYERTPDLAALIAGSGQCDLNTSNTVQSHQGQIDSLLKSWNTRLGIYRPGGPTVAEAMPDWSGWVYNPATWPDQANAFGDFAQRRAAEQAQERFGNVPLPNPNYWGDMEDFQNGADRRLVVGPVVSCDALGSNGTTAILDWACYLILHPVYDPNETMWLEYRGIAGDIGSGCVTSGLPGGPTAGGPKVPALVQ